MPVQVDAVQNSLDLPSQVDAVVIGAGISGTWKTIETVRKVYVVG